MYGLSLQDLAKSTHMHIKRVSASRGVPLSLHDMSTYNRGPVAQVAIGCQVSFLDITPSLVSDEERKAVRIEVPEGTLTVFDGESRFSYASAIPGFTACHQNENYFLITFEMDYQQCSANIGWIPDLRVHCLQTPIRKENVTGGRHVRDLSGYPIYTSDYVQVIIKNLHTRAQRLDSHLLTMEHKWVNE
jgi:hypothetical protein